MDTIDASKVDTSLTRHSYFGSNRTVLADLSSLLLDGKPPKKRFGMRERQTEKGPYYVFRHDSIASIAVGCWPTLPVAHFAGNDP